MEDEPLPLDFPDVPERPGIEVLPAAIRHKREVPIYRRLHGSSHKCDTCTVMAFKWPAPVPQAKWERRVRGEGARYLCGPCKTQWKETDGLAGVLD